MFLTVSVKICGSININNPTWRFNCGTDNRNGTSFSNKLPCDMAGVSVDLRRCEVINGK